MALTPQTSHPTAHTDLSKGEETRRAILDHAVAVASRVGLEALSIGSLARDLAMSKSGLFAHFDSKENLQLAVLRHAGDRFIETVWAPALKVPRGEPRLVAFFERWIEWERAQFLPGGCPFIHASSEVDDRPGPVRDHLVATQRDQLAGLAQAARIAVQEGHFRADLDVEQFGYELYSIILAYHHFARLLRDPRALDRAREAFATLLAASRAGDVPAAHP